MGMFLSNIPHQVNNFGIECLNIAVGHFTSGVQCTRLVIHTVLFKWHKNGLKKYSEYIRSPLLPCIGFVQSHKLSLIRLISQGLTIRNFITPVIGTLQSHFPNWKSFSLNFKQNIPHW